MNHSDDAQKPASLRLAGLTTNDGWSSVSFTPHATTVSQICQKSLDDTLTATEAIDYSDFDATGDADEKHCWIENQVQAGRMSPRWAREYHDHCPQWLAEYAVANYSMAEARQ